MYELVLYLWVKNKEALPEAFVYSTGIARYMDFEKLLLTITDNLYERYISIRYWSKASTK